MVQATNQVAKFYLLDKPVSATFVISCSGAFVDQNGSSRGISSAEDLAHLIHLRNQASAVVIGGNTARKEAYSPKSRFETYVFSETSNVPSGLQRRQFKDDADLQRVFGELIADHDRVLVEAGPNLLNRFLLGGLIDTLLVSIVHTVGLCECGTEGRADIQAIGALVRTVLDVPPAVRPKLQHFGSTVVTRFDCGEP